MTQETMILQHLMRHKKIDPMTAMERYHIMRLASRICDLRRKNIPIEAVTIRNEKTGTHWTEYRLKA